MSKTTKLKNRITQVKELETSFGFEKIQPSDKQNRVNDVFHSVARNYDIMNDIMSLGIHRTWKNIMINWLSPSKNLNWKALDVAGGTGDIAFRTLKAMNYKGHCTVLDINNSMLEVGKEKAFQKNLNEQITFIQGNAEQLPFENESFNSYTIAFGIRNVPRIDLALQEAYRVLKYGGHFLCLEFSEIPSEILSKPYDLWSFYAIPWLGKKITGDEASYQYLVESIRKFPSQKTFAQLIYKSNFKKVSWRNLSGGIAAIHSGWKI